MSASHRTVRGVVAAMVLVLALLVSGCGGLPASGPVVAVQDAGDSDQAPAFAFRPESPQPGATQEQIVEGFLRAGSGPGAAGNWRVAQEFLTPALRSTWRPSAGVTIDVAGERASTQVDDTHVTVGLEPVATVDAAGAYMPSDGGRTVLPFTLEQVDGEWRISQAPDGVVLDRDQFMSVFRKYSLMYFDPTWTYLVPDVRWFPAANVATRISEALIDGSPSPWLADSVVTAFPEGAALARKSVPLVARTAQVDLTSEALSADRTALDRMQTQLEQSLAMADVTAVEMLVDQVPLPASTVPVRSTRISSLPLVRAEAGFGFLSGDELTEIDGISAAIDRLPATAVQLGPDLDVAAVQVGDGVVGRVRADAFDPLDSRGDLVAPTVDTLGYVWSVPRGNPAAVIAFGPDGATIPVAGAWPDASAIAAMSLSRDGARMAAVVTSGGGTEIWIAGVERDGAGVPVALSDPFTLGTVRGSGAGIAWLDDATVAVLAHTGDEGVVAEQAVGGLQTSVTAPADARSIASGAATAPIRLRVEDGSVLVKRGANWQQSSSGVAVLATQQGSPP